jgi:hypothetical protein
MNHNHIEELARLLAETAGRDFDAPNTKRAAYIAQARRILAQDQAHGVCWPCIAFAGLVGVLCVLAFVAVGAELATHV